MGKKFRRLLFSTILATLLGFPVIVLARAAASVRPQTGCDQGTPGCPASTSRDDKKETKKEEKAEAKKEEKAEKKASKKKAKKEEKKEEKKTEMK